MSQRTRRVQTHTLYMTADLCSHLQLILAKPMVLDTGHRFVMRGNQITVLTGVVTELLPLTEEKIPSVNYHPQRRGVMVLSSRSDKARQMVKKRKQEAKNAQKSQDTS